MQAQHTIGDDGDFCGFIGASPVMNGAYAALARMAQSAAPVMVEGETGTGKELAARALHALGRKSSGPMVAINCAAIPPELLESEIFGHVKGAFTGAVTDRAGAARLADGGVLFFDELTEMPVALQAKLLRFVQTGVFTPVGGTQSMTADLRFVSSTNRDPVKAVAEGRLREDLFYRLSALRVALPPLRARGRDVILLARHFLLRANVQERKSFTAFSPEAEGLMLSHSWPGNVRELEGVIRRAAVMNDGAVMTHGMLGIKISAAPILLQEETVRPFAEVERIVIEQAIRICGGNVTEAARRLGLNPSTIHRKRKEWGK